MTAPALLREAGGRPVICVLRNLTPQALEESLRELAAAIDDAQILMLSGGFSGGDEPDGSSSYCGRAAQSDCQRGGDKTAGRQAPV